MIYTEEILKIAKFMGITPLKGFNENTGDIYYYYSNTEKKDYDSLPFYNTWDEIMPVVIKIENYCRNENKWIISGNCVQTDEKDFYGETKLEAVIKAINWWIENNLDLIQ